VWGSSCRPYGALGFCLGFFPGFRPPRHPSDEDLSLGTAVRRTAPWAIVDASLREIVRGAVDDRAEGVVVSHPCMLHSEA
jgi:hypothetical protein